MQVLYARCPGDVLPSRSSQTYSITHPVSMGEKQRHPEGGEAGSRKNHEPWRWTTVRCKTAWKGRERGWRMWSHRKPPVWPSNGYSKYCRQSRKENYGGLLLTLNIYYVLSAHIWIHLLLTTSLYDSQHFTLCFHIQVLKNCQGGTSPGKSGFKPLCTATKLHLPGRVRFAS